MFNREDEYGEVVDCSRINRDHLSYRKSDTIKPFVISFSIFATLFVVGYSMVDYLDEEGGKKREKAVMGVSHINPYYVATDGELMEMVNQLHTEVETLKREVYMKRVIDDMVDPESLDNQSKEESVEAKRTSHHSARAIYVQQGDTLSTLAEEFYGDEQAFQKIIDANEKLKSGSQTIYVGEKINIPY